MRIAISGMKGSGKDYCTDLIKEHYGAVVLSFSDQLKRICADLFPWLEFDCPPEQKEEPKFYSHVTGKPYSYRDIWTMMNVMVDIDPQILIRRIEKDLRHEMWEHQGQDVHYIIKDLRPHNVEELACCIRHGFRILYVYTDDQPEITHKTEQGYEKIQNRATWEFHNKKNGPDEFLNFFSTEVLGDASKTV